MNVQYENLTLRKTVRMRSYSGPYFPAFGLNTERYGVSKIYGAKILQLRKWNSKRKIRQV